jgi:putative RNA 2'-phosphotransferase
MEQHTQLSKFLSFVLRHRPDSIGLAMDTAGWVSIDELLEKSVADGKALDRTVLMEIVNSDKKSRYAVSEDGLRIRANQGHSVEVELGYAEKIPPIPLYHGTHEAVLKTILKQGLKKMKRHHVHLSSALATAVEVGARHGKPVVLKIDTLAMVKDRVKFFLAANGVWLVDEVDPRYLKIV